MLRFIDYDTFYQASTAKKGPNSYNRREDLVFFCAQKIMSNQNGEKVTIREVYQLNEQTRNELNGRFDKLEEKLDGFALAYALKADLEDAKKRLTKLEQWRWYLAGGIAFLSALLLYFASEIKGFLIRA